MNQQPRRILGEVVARYGTSIAADSQRCEGLLRDLCGNCRREINVLLAALRERVPADLLAASETVPMEVLFARLTQRLQDNCAMDSASARWAVESWALAFGASVGAFPHSPRAAKPKVKTVEETGMIELRSEFAGAVWLDGTQLESTVDPGKITRITTSVGKRRLKMVATGEAYESEVTVRVGVLVQEMALRRRAVVCQLGHSAPISTLSYSRDGRWLATGSSFGVVRIWETVSWREVRTLRGHIECIESVTFSADGRRVAAIAGLRLKVWELETGREVPSESDHGTGVVISSPDGRWLATFGGDNNYVVLWEVAAAALRERILCKSDGARFSAMAYSPDSRWLATGDSRFHGSERPHCGAVHVWDAASGRLERALVGCEKAVGAVAYSPDGQRITAGFVDGTVKVWEAADGHELWTVVGKGDVMRSAIPVVYREFHQLAYSPDGLWIATVNPQQVLAIRDAQTGREAWREKFGFFETIKSYSSDDERGGVAFSPKGRWVAGISPDRAVRVREVVTGRVEHIFRWQERMFVAATAFSPAGRWMATTQGRDVRVWDAATGRVLRTLSKQSVCISAIASSPDGHCMATCGKDSAVTVWETAGRPLRDLPGRANAVAYSPDGRWIAGCGESALKIWEAETGREAITLSVDYGGSSIAYSPDGRLLASRCDNYAVRIWETATGKDVRTLSKHYSSISCVAFSPDGQWIAIGGGKTVRIWDAETGVPVLDLTGRQLHVRAIAWSPDGRLVATGGRGTIVEGWDVRTGELKWTLPANDGAVSAVMFSADGRRLVSGDQSGIRVWSPSTGEIIAELVDLEEGYITYTPDGYYTASPEGDALVVLRANDNSLTNDEAIKARYRRPDIVEARLSVLMS